MPRVKRGTIGAKRRRNVLRKAKGYRFARSKKEIAARDAITHAGRNAFAHRRDKKNDYRRLWQIKIGSALKAEGLSYSKFTGAFRKKGMMINRKMLAELAEKHPATFLRIVKSI
ncbi:50S ribosomal protein L20 [Candidatus Parcubacteria bacterium]|nr:50S ribosomal protein L20 [Candidatus Parcubacteria bacterium]